MKVAGCFRGLLAAAAVTLFAAGPAMATLLPRDLNGDAVTDAFYDTDLNITWLRNANVNGAMNWAAAMAWADGYSIGGYDDWRLPTVTQPDAACSEHSDPLGSFGYNCTGSEMGHLWYTELGNTADAFMTHTGDFENLQFSLYWSGTAHALYSATDAWGFSTLKGYQMAFGKTNDQFRAMAVRPGDVAAAHVPEPESLLLALTALGSLALLRRRRPPPGV